MTTVKAIPELSEFDRNRFWANVRFGEVDECWEWADRVNVRGYGRFWLDGKEYYAHRVAYFLEFGPIPNGKGVLHSCDNTSCENPHHLFSGTQKENMHDMISKGRASFPPGSGVLTKEDVLKIRERCFYGEAQVSVAKDFGIRQPTVSDIILRKAWAHV